MRPLVVAGLLSSLLTVSAALGAGPLSVNGAQRFQVIDGFGVSANSASWNGAELPPAIDDLTSLGSSIFRVIIDNTDWETTNDNADPAVFNWTAYNQIYTSPKFEKLWSTLSYLNQRGLTSSVILSFMGPIPAWMGGNHLESQAQSEWVEMVASAAYYAWNVRGLRFGMLSPANETDWDGIEGPLINATAYADVMNQLAGKLDAIGLSTIRLIGPDTARIDLGVGSYMPAMMTKPTLMAKVDHLSFHNYDGWAGGAAAAIQASAFPSRNFWMTELSLSDHAFATLEQGASAVLVWDGYDSVYNHAILAGRGSTPPNDAGNGPALLSYNTATHTYARRKVYYEVAHIFQFVAPGAQRIAAISNDQNLTTLAFHKQATGALTIVGRNSGSTSITVNGTLSQLTLPTAFAHYRTNASLNLQRQADVPLANSAFSFVVPAQTTFTLSAAPVVTPVAALGRGALRAAHVVLLACALGVVGFLSSAGLRRRRVGA